VPKRKKRTQLPRLTVLAWSKADLVRITEAVERIVSEGQMASQLVQELHQLNGEGAALIAELQRAVAERRRPARARKTEKPAPASPPPAPAVNDDYPAEEGDW
jgi:hypothetical protein